MPKKNISKKGYPGHTKYRKKVNGKWVYYGDNRYRTAPKGSPRQKRLCARFRGMKKKFGPTPKITGTLRSWNC